MSRSAQPIKDIHQPSEGFCSSVRDAASARGQDVFASHAAREDLYHKKIASEALEGIDEGRVGVLKGDELRQSLSALCGSLFVDELDAKYGS